MLVFIRTSLLTIFFVPVKFQWIELKTTHMGTLLKCLIPIGAGNQVQSLRFRKQWSTQKGTRCLCRAFESPDPWRILFSKHCCERNISVTEAQVTNSPLRCTETSQSSGFHSLKSLLKDFTHNLSNQTLWHPLQHLRHISSLSLAPSLPYPEKNPTKKPTQNHKGQKNPNPNSTKQREREGEWEKRPCFAYGTPG